VVAVAARVLVQVLLVVLVRGVEGGRASDVRGDAVAAVVWDPALLYFLLELGGYALRNVHLMQARTGADAMLTYL
jgi:hypothetical protein